MEPSRPAHARRSGRGRYASLPKDPAVSDRKPASPSRKHVNFAPMVLGAARHSYTCAFESIGKQVVVMLLALSPFCSRPINVVHGNSRALNARVAALPKGSIRITYATLDPNMVVDGDGDVLSPTAGQLLRHRFRSSEIVRRSHQFVTA